MKKNIIDNISQEKVDELVSYCNKGQLSEALNLAKSLVDKNPSSFFLWNISGIANAGLKKLKEAEICFKRTIKINPNFVDAYYNLANSQQEQGKLKEAISNYKHSIKLNPNFIMAHNNLGNALKELGELKKAEQSYKNAIKLKPNFLLALINLGSAQSKQGKFEEAISSYIEALKINKNFIPAVKNLIDLLSFFNPKNEKFNPIIKVNKLLQNIKLQSNEEKKISDEEISTLYGKCKKLVDLEKIDVKYDKTQIYKGNKFSLNCDRHMGIFNKFNIIP